jgi:hypothetical protein
MNSEFLAGNIMLPFDGEINGTDKKENGENAPGE